MESGGFVLHERAARPGPFRGTGSGEEIQGMCGAVDGLGQDGQLL
jgi:hypothetical protein